MTTPPAPDLPLFPTDAPDVFADRAATRALFTPVLARLADVVDIGDHDPAGPTSCDNFDLAGLQQHVLAWLQFFAAALTDPGGQADRIDPETWSLGQDEDPAGIVRRSASLIDQAIEAGVATHTVVMSQARMAGDGVLAMALGEYLVHGWDLATATGKEWEADDNAAESALAFLQTTVAPEYRGPDTGFFDAEVEPPTDASTFERLLCFAGRDPRGTA